MSKATMKTTFKYDHYCKQDEIEKHVKKLAKTYPDLFDYEYILTTPDKHHQIAVTASSPGNGASFSKIGVLG